MAKKRAVRVIFENLELAFDRARHGDKLEAAFQVIRRAWIEDLTQIIASNAAALANIIKLQRAVTKWLRLRNYCKEEALDIEKSLGGNEASEGELILLAGPRKRIAESINY